MTTSAEDSVELKSKPVRTQRLSLHKSRRRKRIAARVALVLGIVIGVSAIAAFVFIAYVRASAVEEMLRLAPSSENPSDVPLWDDLMRWDAIAAIIAVVLLLGSTLISRKMRRGRREHDDHALRASRLKVRFLGRWPFLTNQFGMIFAPRRGANADGTESITMRHRARRRMKIAARIALILGLVIVVSAVSDFAYNAHVRSSSLDEIGRMNEDGRIMSDDASDNPAARRVPLAEERQQMDAVAAVLAAACVITFTVISRRIEKHQR
jgi:hypothetical protein